MFNYILYRIGQFIALSLPIKTAYKIAVFVSDVHYIFAFKDRRNVESNLKAIFPEKKIKEIRRIKIRMFRNFAKYLVDFFRFENINKEYINKNIKIENIEYLDKALAEKKGAIITTAHLGIWELGGVIVSLLGYPMWAVALPHKSKKVNNFFNYQRQSKGLKVIPLGKAAKTCINALKNNQIIALVGDREFGTGGITVNFFKRPSVFPEGPAAFSLKTGARIIPAFMIRNDDDTFTLKIEGAVEFHYTGDKEEDTRNIIEKYKEIFEDYIKKYPDQWYMFRLFWKS